VASARGYAAPRQTCMTRKPTAAQALFARCSVYDNLRSNQTTTYSEFACLSWNVVDFLRLPRPNCGCSWLWNVASSVTIGAMPQRHHTPNFNFCISGLIRASISCSAYPTACFPWTPEMLATCILKAIARPELVSCNCGSFC
jgi:hypothetical protein